MGIGAGALGSGKGVITCLKCGNQFPAGAGAIKKTDGEGKVTIVYQVPQKKKFGTGKVIALIFLVIFIYRITHLVLVAQIGCAVRM